MAMEDLIEEEDYIPGESEDEGEDGPVDIAVLVANEIEDSVNYDQSEYQQDRVKAINYYNGIMTDVPHDIGRSAYVSRDVSDTIGELMPSIMRVFFSSDTMADYEPSTPQDEQFAKDASTYISHYLNKKCNIYRVMWDVFFDSLLLRNGIIHHYFDPTPTINTYQNTGMTYEQVNILEMDPTIEIVDIEMKQLEVSSPAGPIPVTLFDVEYTQSEDQGQIVVESVPPEEFLINRDATDLESARFKARRRLVTRSYLLERGFDEEKIDTLSTYNELAISETKQARWENENLPSQDPTLDWAMEEVEIFDVYMLVDKNGDGIAEWRHIICGDMPSEDNILLDELWSHHSAFTDVTPMPIPHRWQGNSIFDDVEDLQQIKTVVTRGTLDSLYASMNPHEFINQQAIVNREEALSRKLGKQVLTKGDPRLAIHTEITQFVGDKTLPMLDKIDEIKARRVGTNPTALEPEALQNQTAMAAGISQSNQYAKVELITRHFAFQLVPFFRAMLRLVVQHTTDDQMLWLNGQFRQFDPRSWNAEMDCEVNTGLGTGSRERDFAMLQLVAAEQDKYLMSLGVNNPICSLKERRLTSVKLAEAGGIKNADMFFKNPTPEQWEQLYAKEEEKANQPDPKVQADQEKAMAQIQLEQQKAQAKLQLESQEAQAKMAMEMEQMREEHRLKMAELQRESELKIAEMQRQFQLKVAEMEVNAGLKVDQVNKELGLKRYQIDEEVKLAKEKNAQDAAIKTQVTPGGDPG